MQRVFYQQKNFHHRKEFCVRKFLFIDGLTVTERILTVADW